MGIKIRAKINLLEEVAKTQEEATETPSMETSEQEPEIESRNNETSISPYILGGVAGVVLAVCLFTIALWWRGR